ncbi:MAG: aldo/keto reductase, partial [Proteobacteria bacterium]|nr:aldo/keto reductase [Pseudomonadota bacterium]
MQKRILGKNHLEVSSIGLGCWGMSHAYGRADEKESLATINHCLDHGINFLDTADIYGHGHNESLIAKILKKRRHEAVVATKFGFVGDEKGNLKVNGRPKYVQKACEKSLMRLNIDEIDLYYFH